jgi:hypothetical protein
MGHNQRYPSVGPGAYTPYEINWCQAKYEFLVSQMDGEGQAKHNIPQRVWRSSGPARVAAAGPARAAAAAAPLPPGDVETENDNDECVQLTSAI